VLATAQEGLYAADRMRGLSTRQVADHFVRQGEGQVASFRVAPQLASMITFKQLNLMDPLPMPGPLDVIFCRNVIIYFDKETQRQLFVRMSRLQRPGNLLCLGHSENLFKVSDDYSLVGKTIYRRS
jgi:chemotaxis protein methyltransferase CheR